MEKRKKPTFLRRDWHKRIKLGKTVKKNQKWRAAKGRHNKIRLGVKGYSKRPKIGYSENKKIRNLINEKAVRMVSNIKDLNELKKADSVIISKVGAKKRKEIIEVCNKKGILILNKYRKSQNELIK